MVARRLLGLWFCLAPVLPLVACGGIGWDPQDDDAGDSDDDADDDGGDDDDDADDDADDDTWSDDDSGDPGAQGPPTLDPYPPYTNEAQMTLSGTAEIPGSTITIYGAGTYTAVADGATGAFALQVALQSGMNHLAVTATFDGLQSAAVSALVERCDPSDHHEADGGDTCQDAVDLGPIPDSSASIEVTGNLVPSGDEDWYTFVAADDLNADQWAGEDYWEPKVEFVRNDDDFFVFQVFRGSCQGLECPDLGTYTAYSYNLGLGPCDPPHDFCADHTTPLWIHVVQAAPGEAACRAYTLRVHNGP